MQNVSLIGSVNLEKKSFKRFLPYMGMAAILNFESQPFTLILYNHQINTYFIQIGSVVGWLVVFGLTAL